MGGGLPLTFNLAFKRLIRHINISSILPHATCNPNTGRFRLRLATLRDVNAHICKLLFIFSRLRSMDLKRCFAFSSLGRPRHALKRVQWARRQHVTNTHRRSSTSITKLDANHVIHENTCARTCCCYCSAGKRWQVMSRNLALSREWSTRHACRKRHLCYLVRPSIWCVW